MKSLKYSINEKLKLSKELKIRNTDIKFIPKSKIEFDRYVVEQKQKVGESGTKNHPVDLSCIDFSELSINENDEVLSYYFFDDNDIAYLDMSYCKFNGISSIDHMFEESTLVEVNITGWELNNVYNISGLFLDCFKLENVIGLENLDVSNVRKMTSLFCNCVKLKSVDLSKWDISNIEKMATTFKKCHELTDVGDLSNWDLKEVLTIRGMFKECFKLKTIKGIEKWKLPKIKSIAGIFLGDKDLNINIDSWNLSHDVDQTEAFDGTNINPSWAN